MNGVVASTSAFPYNLTIFHANSIYAVAGAATPLMGGGVPVDQCCAKCAIAAS